MRLRNLVWNSSRWSQTQHVFGRIDQLAWLKPAVIQPSSNPTPSPRKKTSPSGLLTLFKVMLFILHLLVLHDLRTCSFCVKSSFCWLKNLGRCRHSQKRAAFLSNYAFCSWHNTPIVQGFFCYFSRVDVKSIAIYCVPISVYFDPICVNELLGWLDLDNSVEFISPRYLPLANSYKLWRLWSLFFENPALLQDQRIVLFFLRHQFNGRYNWLKNRSKFVFGSVWNPTSNQHKYN